MVNKVILIGRLGKDPELKAFEGNRKVANFSIATTEKYTDKAGNKQEITDWHNIAIWGPQADIAGKYLKKGMHVYLKKYTTEVVVDNFRMLDSKKDGDNTSMPNEYASNDEIADDLPF
jgi:single-strand DNA-binding protein